MKRTSRRETVEEMISTKMRRIREEQGKSNRSSVSCRSPRSRREEEASVSYRHRDIVNLESRHGNSGTKSQDLRCGKSVAHESDGDNELRGISRLQRLREMTSSDTYRGKSRDQISRRPALSSGNYVENSRKDTREKRKVTELTRNGSEQFIDRSVYSQGKDRTTDSGRAGSMTDPAGSDLRDVIYSKRPRTDHDQKLVTLDIPYSKSLPGSARSTASIQYTKKTTNVETVEHYIKMRPVCQKKPSSRVVPVLEVLRKSNRESISNSNSDKSTLYVKTGSSNGRKISDDNSIGDDISFSRRGRDKSGIRSVPSVSDHRFEPDTTTDSGEAVSFPWVPHAGLDTSSTSSVTSQWFRSIKEGVKIVTRENNKYGIESDEAADTDDDDDDEEEEEEDNYDEDDDEDDDLIMAGRKNLNKNAISAFEEYGVQQRQPPKVEVVSKSGPPHRPVFFAVAKLGDCEICSEQGHSKHEARIKAAERALQILSIQRTPDVGASGDIETTGNQPTDSSDEDVSNPVPYKDPVSALMEFAQFAKLDVSFDLISQEGPPHMPIFTMAVKLGSQMCPSVQGGSAKETKKRAACMALNKLKKDGALQALFPDTKSSAIPVGKIKTKSALGIPGKNPVSVLNEYAQKSSTKLRFESSQTGPPHKPVFNVWAILGEENFPVVKAASKKEGNVQAAETVLRLLEERGQYVMPKAVLGQPTINSTMPAAHHTHHDRIAAAAVRKVDELLLQTPESLVGRKVIAAIVMLDEEQRVYRVISVGSGNRCVKGSHITDDGTVLHDSHAEVLARRGFKRFLYWLLRTKDLPILVQGSQGKLRFKDGLSFHLYISTAPCGDGALFTHSDRGVEGSSCPGSKHQPVFTNTRTQGLLRAKQENGEGTIPVEPEFVGQTYDGIQQGGRLRVMSCSDKICQWNVLGLQGALLSREYEPIYLQSITLGNLYNAGHLARAVCCRIDHGNTRLQSQLPSGFYVNHPDLGVTSCQDTTRVVEKARPLSINWAFGDKEPEITDGTIGKTTKTVERTVGPSRLCKKSLLCLYRETVDSTSHLNSSYKQIKLDSDDYNQAKMALHRRLQEQNYGFWVCMPREVDRF